VSAPDLAEFARQLAHDRDLLAEFSNEASQGEAQGYRMALAYLHVHTHGEYGEPLPTRPARATP
jgi:hypothetical protein